MEETHDKITTEYYIGNSRTTEWSSVYYYSPQVPATFEEKGQIFAIISLASPPTFDAQTAGNFLLDQLHETYFESDEESNLVALEKTVLAVKKRLLELLENDEATSQEGVEMHIMALVLKDNVAYAVRLGEAKLYGMRESLTTDISSVLKDPDGKKEIATGSFRVHDLDQFMLLTPEAEFEMKMPEIEKSFLNKSLDTLKAKHIANEALVSILRFEINPEDMQEELSDDVDPGQSAATLRGQMLTIEETESEEGEVRTEVQKKSFEQNMLREELDSGVRIKDSLESFTKKIGTEVPGKSGELLGKIKQTIEDIKYDRNARTFKVVLVKIISAISNGISVAYNFIKQDILKISNSRTYTRSAHTQKNWRPLVFFGLILVLLVYFVASSIRKRNEIARLEFEASAALSAAEEEIDQLQEEVGGLTTTYDRAGEKESAYQKVLAIRSDLEEVTAENFTEQRDENLTKLQELEYKVLRSIPISDPTMVRDFGVLEGSTPNDIEISDQFLFVSDNGVDVIYKLNHDGGDSGRIVEDLTNVQTIAYSEVGELLFVDDNSERVVGVYTLEDQTIKRLPGINGSRLGDVVDLDAYKVAENDFRLYGARQSSNEVIYLQRGTGGYGLPNIRLENREFSNLLDLEINNGRVYVLPEGQGVRAFYGDSEITFDPRGMREGDSWNSVTSMYIDDRYIYLGDNENKRILVFTKFRGNSETILDFVAQYDLSSLSEGDKIADIVTDLQSNSLFVLANTKIYKLDLELLRSFDY